MNAEGSFALDIDLYVEVSMLPEEQAVTLIENAHKVYQYSNAVQGNLEVLLYISVT